VAAGAGPGTRSTSPSPTARSRCSCCTSRRAYSSTTRGTAPPTPPWSLRSRPCPPGTSPLRRTLLVAW